MAIDKAAAALHCIEHRSCERVYSLANMVDEQHTSSLQRLGMLVALRKGTKKV